MSPQSENREVVNVTLSSNAQKLYNYLPKDGSKVGGISAKRDLSLNTTELKDAKDELKEEKLIVVGQGRGGSMARAEGIEPEPEVVVTKEERMAHAREAKVANSRERKDISSLREKILTYVNEEFPQVEAKDITFSGANMMPIIEVKSEKGSRMYTIPQLEYDKIRAEQR